MGKQLGELLQEQQEPFILELYLLERGYLRRSSFSSNRCCSRNSTKSLKRSVSCGLNTRRRVIPNCSKIIKTLLNRISSIKRSEDKSTETAKTSPAIDQFSSASGSTVFESCTESGAEDTYDNSLETTTACNAPESDNVPGEEEVETNRKVQRVGEECKQLSPVSVLEEINICYQAKRNNVSFAEKEPVFPVALCKLEDYSPRRELKGIVGRHKQEIPGSNRSSQYTKNKRALQQSKQLLFDCVGEVVESQRRRDSRSLQFQQILGPEEIWKLLSENIWIWSKQPIDETNITHLLNHDFLASAKEWSEFEAPNWDISMEIGDAVVDDISSEIVTDMLKLVSTNIRKAT